MAAVVVGVEDVVAVAEGGVAVPEGGAVVAVANAVAVGTTGHLSRIQDFHI